MAEPSEKKDEQDASGLKVGALLQASRQRLGEELTDVASILRIRLPYLVAIEAGRHQELPGATYAVGFIRAYAEHLGLDSEEVVRRFKLEAVDSGEGNKKLSFPTPVPETGIPGGAYVFIGLILAVLGYGSWYLSTIKDDLFSNVVSPLDQQIVTVLPDSERADSEKSEIEGGSDAAIADAEPAELEQSKIESGSDAAKADAEPAELEQSKIESGSDTVIADAEPAELEQSKIESGPDTAKADVSAEKVETELATDIETPSQGAPEARDGNIILVDEASSGPTPKAEASIYALNPISILQPNAKKFSAPKIGKINAKKPKSTFVKPAEVEKAISVGEEPLKFVAKMQQSSKPKPKEVSDNVASLIVLGTETELVLPELSADLEETSTLAPIETVTRGSPRIKINAINNSWIQIRDDNSNTMLVTRLLAAGDSYAVPDQPGLVLLTGNAGALEIVVDGTAVPSIGGLGIVRRGVLLEVDKLKAGAAVSN